MSGGYILKVIGVCRYVWSKVHSTKECKHDELVTYDLSENCFALLQWCLCPFLRVSLVAPQAWSIWPSSTKFLSSKKWRFLKASDYQKTLFVCTDMCVCARAIGWWVRDTTFSESYEGEKVTKEYHFFSPYNRIFYFYPRISSDLLFLLTNILE